MVGVSKLSPYLIVDGGNAALEWYQKALGAEVKDVAYVPDTDKIMNAQLMLGDSRFMLNDEFPDYGALGPLKVGGSSVTMHIESTDVDADWERIVAAGAEITMPLDNQFWGMRYGQFRDPFGHCWSIGQQISNPTKEEMEAAMKEQS